MSTQSPVEVAESLEAIRRRKWKCLGHTFESLLVHQQASFDLESSREAKERSAMEHLETFVRNRDQVYGQGLILARDGCTGQGAMERDC